MPFLSAAQNGSIEIHIYVQPRASKTRIVGLHDGLLKVAVTSPPIGGKANREVVKFIAKCLNISRSGIVVCTGWHSRRKVLATAILQEDEIRRAFEPFCKGV